jgi:diguanylate cyclase (GGDEF)-like protein
MIAFFKDWLAGTLTRKFTLLLAAFLALQTIQLSVGIFSLLHLAEESRLINEAGKQRLRLTLLQLLVHKAADADWGPADSEQLVSLSAEQDRVFEELGHLTVLPFHGDLLGPRAMAQAHWENSIKPLLTVPRLSDASGARAVKALLAALVPEQLVLADRMVDEYQRDSSSDARDLALFQAAALVLSLLLGVIGMIMAQRIVTEPLRRLTEASDSIAGGAYDRRVAVSSGDEIGRLASTFNRMAAAVGEKTSRIAALNEIAIRLTVKQSLRELLDEIMRRGMALTGAQAACIAFYNEGTLRFDDWLTEGLSDHFVKNMNFRPGGLADEAFTTATWVLSNDRPETRHKLSRLSRDENILSFVCMPLASHASRQGVVYFYRKDRDHFLPDEIETLNTFAHLAASAIESARLRDQLQDIAITDKLTGLRNRRLFDERLADEILRATRYGKQLSLLLLDIDDFKRINDTRGHPAGDRVLQSLGRSLPGQLRQIDLAARYGGEEFAIVLPETDAIGAKLVGDRIRRMVADTPVSLADGGEINLTVSVGVACFPLGGDGAESLVEHADKALYAAKRAGKNRVRLYSEIPEA